METTRRVGGVVEITAIDNIFTARVKMTLGKNKVAMVKGVQFHPPKLTNAVTQYFLAALVARPDVTFSEEILPDTKIEERASFEDRPDVIAITSWFALTLISQPAFSWHSQYVPVPGAGFPVINEMTLIAVSKSSAVAADTPTIACEVYYEEKKVSKDEWIMLLKRQSNAPRDLNVPQDPGGTWGG